MAMSGLSHSMDGWMWIRFKGATPVSARTKWNE